MTPAQGLFLGAAAFLFWGFSPIFWKWLEGVPPFEILAHRVLWSALLLLPILLYRKRREELITTIKRRPGELAFVVAAAALIGWNWYYYVLAMVTHQVLASSLAYFLTPIGNVLVGVLLLGERLDRVQTFSFLLAALAMILQTVAMGQLPVLVLLLAGTFATYGYFKKRISMGGDLSVLLENLLLAPIMISYLYLHGGHHSPSTWVLLALTGPVTALPLVWYAKAIQKISLVSVGFLQFLSPITQFILAVCCYHEPFTSVQGATFFVIWLALGLFSWDMLVRLSK